MKHTNRIFRAVGEFALDDQGGQVVEYGLILAVISIVLVLALNGMTTGNYFNTFIGRLSDCLNTKTCF